MNVILDTSLFLIGGSVFMNNKDILLPMVREEFEKSFHALSAGKVIMPCKLGENIGNVAALSLVLPKDWIGSWKEKEIWKVSVRPTHLLRTSPSEKRASL